MEKFIIGIDAGATNIKVGLIDPANYRIIYTTLFGTRHYTRKKEDLINAFVKAVNFILLNKHLSRKNILAFGLGLPGPIDSQKGIVHFLPNISGWNEVPLKKILESRLKIPVFVDNDVKLITLAEWKLGAGKGVKNLLCITLGTGVGGGLILNNRLYRGENFLAGEIGHMPINELGPVCNCGGSACLERYIGNKYILSAAKRIFKDKKITLEKISALARKGDRKAIRIWQDVGRRLGIALSGAINLLNLQMVIIGGGVSAAGSPLFNSVKETVKLRSMPSHSIYVKIVKSKIGQEAGILGAAILAKENL
jgi:glucokinase